MGNAQLDTEIIEANLDRPLDAIPDDGFDIFQTPVLGKNYFSFRVSHLGFLVPINIHCELLDKYQVNRLPNVPPWFHGLINLRGNLVPVFDIRRILDDNENTATLKKRHLFVIGRGEKAVAFWIDSYPEILDIALMQSSVEPIDLPAILQTVLARIWVLNGQIWLDCDLDRLFSALGRHYLAIEETVV